jgi:UMF1 family MFS transporter
MQQQTSKKLHRSWAMYDWANSAYNLVITSTIFPAYYTAVTTVKNSSGTIINDNVSFMGRTFKSGALFNYSVATAYLLIAILSPILSSIADYKGNKKLFMQFFCILGSIACCGLFFFRGSTLEWGLFCSTLAAVGYCGSLVFYNAYLPEIAVEADRDRVSAQGFAYGYIGSVILQVLCFVFVLNEKWFADATLPARLSFLMVGAWWFAFAQIPFRKLPSSPKPEQHPEHNIFFNGFHELKKVWKQVKQLPVLRTYLGSFFLYSMGVQTVMLAATIFGSTQVKRADGSNLGMQELIISILIIQLVAIAGAYLMAKLSGRFGNMKVLLFTLIIWIGVCIAAYNTYTDMQFYALATVVGLIMGGIQSLSRSTYSKLMPETKDTASFFSFYDVTEKLAIVIGMFSFGFIEELTGSMRNSILALLSFFALGAIILLVAIRKQGLTAKAQRR